MKTEIWKSHPDIPGVQVSTLGRVRTLDKMVWNGKGTYSKKGRILKQYETAGGYLVVNIQIDGKQTRKLVHRLVAQTFIDNQNNLPQVNHLDCDRTNNNVENLEFCTRKENIAYRDKLGHTARNNAPKSPVFAVNLKTLEVSQFQSQHEAGRVLGVNVGNINGVIKGRTKQAHGYWFKADDGNGIESDKDKLKSIVDSMIFTRCVFVVNLKTLEVSRFNSQSEASRVLGVSQGNIYSVIKGKRKQTGGFWFTNADDNADDAINRKLHDVKKIYN